MATRVPLFWFHFDDADDARAVTRRAAYAGIVSAVLTAALATWALASPDGVFGGTIDAWAFLDVALVLALSAGTYRGNRFAATALLVVYVAEQVASRVPTGNTGGLFVSGLFTVLFVQGMLGAFALHRLRP
ncbi:MAG TPA: hypothetical protein VF594_04495, partial [Rubricoccaceae bacterium]